MGVDSDHGGEFEVFEGYVKTTTNVWGKLTLIHPTGNCPPRGRISCLRTQFHWGAVLGSKEGVYVLKELCRRNL